MRVLLVFAQRKGLPTPRAARATGGRGVDEVVAAVECDRDHCGDGVEPHRAPRISFARRQKRTRGVEQRASRLQLMPAGPAGRADVRLSTSWGCRRCRAVSDVGAAFSCPNSLRLSTFTEGCDAREQARGPESRWPASNLRRDRCGAAGRGPRCAPRSVMKLFAGHLDFWICSAPTRSRGCISENISRLACWRLYLAFDGLGDALVVSSTASPVD